MMWMVRIGTTRDCSRVEIGVRFASIIRVSFFLNIKSFYTNRPNCHCRNNTSSNTAHPYRNSRHRLGKCTTRTSQTNLVLGSWGESSSSKHRPTETSVRQKPTTNKRLQPRQRATASLQHRCCRHPPPFREWRQLLRCTRRGTTRPIPSSNHRFVDQSIQKGSRRHGR